jgi:type III restriction enzyme
LESRQLITEAVNTLGASVKNINDLKSGEIQKLAFEKMVTNIENNPQQNLFKLVIIEAAKKEYESVISELIEKTIPIPRVLIQQKHDVKSGFKDFSLDVAGLNYQPVSEEIIRRTLRTNESEILQSESSGVVRDIPENILVNELINYPEVDYDREAELLYKLARQAIAKLGNRRNGEDLKNIVLYHKREIGKYIYAQLQKHFYLESSGFEEPLIYPFDRIKPHNFSKYTADSVHHYTETITPTNTIPSKVFGGFKKACHNLYKFDSKAEKDFATILENDKVVLKWLRPADSQFELYWKYNSKRYHPDFVVEIADIIFMVEIKAEKDIDDAEVQEKVASGKKYCEAATTFNLANGGKKWTYVLIPHTAVVANMSLKGLCK